MVGNTPREWWGHSARVPSLLGRHFLQSLPDSLKKLLMKSYIFPIFRDLASPTPNVATYERCRVVLNRVCKIRMPAVVIHNEYDDCH